MLVTAVGVMPPVPRSPGHQALGNSTDQTGGGLWTPGAYQLVGEKTDSTLYKQDDERETWGACVLIGGVGSREGRKL